MWVKSRRAAQKLMSAALKADMCGATRHVRFVPCVDGSKLARTFFTFAALVGAAMCSAFQCGARGRWP